MPGWWQNLTIHCRGLGTLQVALLFHLVASSSLLSGWCELTDPPRVHAISGGGDPP